MKRFLFHNDAASEKGSAPVTLCAAVADHLRAAIVTGELTPGSLLREVALADELGVSATPVREALRKLAAEGLVEIEPNRLRRVAPRNTVDIVDMVTVQATLWSLAYRRAFPRLDASDLARLEAAVSLVRQGVSAHDPLVAMDGLRGVSRCVLARSGSKEVQRLTTDRRALLERELVMLGHELIDDGWLEAQERMLAAVRSRDINAFMGSSDAMLQRLLALLSLQCSREEAAAA